MKSLLILLLASSSFAEVPFSSGDYPANENFRYLDGNKLSVRGGGISGKLTVGGGLEVSTSTYLANLTVSSITGNVSMSGDMLISGNLTLGSKLLISSVTEHGSSLSGPNDRQPVVVWAKLVDTLSISSGCVGVLKMSGVASSSFLMFTSTTTEYGAADTGLTAVLFDDSCSPNSYCRIAISGLVRAQMTAGQAAGQSLHTYTTRCKGRSADTLVRGYNGITLSAGDGGWNWVMLGGGW